MCAFTICSGALVATCLCAVHVCRSLTSLVEAFLSEALARSQNTQKHEREQQSARLVIKWKRVRAVIRFSSGAVERLLVCLHIAMLSALLMGAIDLCIP